MKGSFEYIMRIETDEDGFNTPVYSQKKVEKNYVKTYGDTVYKLLDIEGCASKLIFYLAMKMDEHNIVQVASYNKEKFLKDIKTKGSGDFSYSDASINAALKKLKDADLLLSQGKRGKYQVNPEYFFKGNSEKRRLDMIKESLEKDLDEISDWKKNRQ